MSRELLKQALYALKYHSIQTRPIDLTNETIEALRQELAKPTLPMSPEHLPQYIATNNIKPTTEGGGGAGGKLAKPEQELVAHAVIAGVLFDFMGWLTSRQERIVLSSCDDASPAVKVIEEFAIMRGLSLDDAKVKDWQDMIAPPPKREWVGLTNDEINDFSAGCHLGKSVQNAIYQAAAKLKERNT